VKDADLAAILRRTVDKSLTSRADFSLMNPRLFWVVDQCRLR
jgi:hypothetical protein